MGILLSPCLSDAFLLQDQGSLLQRLLGGWVGVERERETGKGMKRKALGSSGAYLPNMLQALGSTPGLPINTYTHVHFGHEKLFCWFRDFFFFFSEKLQPEAGP